tara:strand:- start:3073 stop:3816 length:744 start_codon:yes stop_codon:yes gene_type:complete
MPTDLQDVLPDPNYKRYFDGTKDTSGTTGPGFAQIKLNNDQKILATRTNSQRLIARAIAGQKWKIDINYNPMTLEEFSPVYSFLLEKQGPMSPFFISLPQYRVPQNSTWASTVTSTSPVYTHRINESNGYAAGISKVLVDGDNSYSPTTTNIPKPGDMCTFDDANHKKAYLITAVEINAKYQTGTIQPGATEFRMTLSPPLVKAVVNNAAIQFSVPLIKVVMPQPLGSYELNKDNLYSFNLKLEEYL